MITVEYVRTMARYNAWQNDSLYRAAEDLGDARRKAPKGAFFGSIHGTLSHLLWGDTIWMSRFDGWDRPEVGIPDSGNWVSDWSALAARRRQADAGIRNWSERLTDAQLQGDLTWYSGAIHAEVTKPLALCIVHFFNHQTHHRGQAHALLTSEGARPDDTDLFIMPGAP